MNQHKRMFFVTACAMALLVAHAQGMPFAEFLKEHVPAHEHASFSDYYHKIIKKIKAESALKKKQMLDSLRSTGLTRLQVRDSQLARKFTDTFSCSSQDRKLLQHHGAYENYCNNKIIEGQRIFGRFKSYISDIGNSIVHMVCSVKQSVWG